MTDEILRRLAQNLPPNHRGRWLVGFSGGLDSTVLLHALKNLVNGQSLAAIHVNHGLSASADVWQQHCQDVCQRWGVPLQVEKVAISGEGAIEERAREARFEVFARSMAEGDCLLLAHHRQDQAETVLFRLLRGAGISGLGAIRLQRSFARGQILRPLLAVDRAELETYAEAHGLAWVEDESNTDPCFDRNYLRQDILPALRSRWPGADRNLALTARHCQEADQLLAELAGLDLARLQERDEAMGVSLDLIRLRQLSAARRRNLLRYWLRMRFNERVSLQLSKDIEMQLIGGDSSAAQVAGKNVLLRQFQTRLYALWLDAQWQPASDEPHLEWSCPERPLTLPGRDSLCWQPVHPEFTGGGPWRRALARQHLARRLTVAWRSGAERCRPAGRRHSQTVKKLLQELVLPTWLRARIPLLYIDGELAAVGDLWVCETFAAAPDEAAVHLHWSFPPGTGKMGEGGICH